MLEIGTDAFGALSEPESIGYTNGWASELVIPASVRRIGAKIGQSFRRVVFEPGEVFLEGPIDMHDGLEIVVPEGHPTLEMADGNLYSLPDARLIAQTGTAPIREGTRIIERYALNTKTAPVIPESAERICYYIGDWWYMHLPEAVYAVPGSPAEAYFENGGNASW